MRSLIIAAATTAAIGFGAIAPAFAENVKTEAAEHPRIAAAIHELREAVAYMEKAPHDFGGHKAKAISDSRAAIIQLEKALAYRARQDNKK